MTHFVYVAHNIIRIVKEAWRNLIEPEKGERGKNKLKISNKIFFVPSFIFEKIDFESMVES